MTKTIFKINGVEAQEPAGFLERVELPVDGDAIEAPVYESHKRGKNWACVLIGKNAANMTRSFLPQRLNIIDVSALSRGNAIEIAGDYTSSGGNPSRTRWIGVVVENTDELLIVDTYASVAKAMSAANKGILSAVVEDEDIEILAEMADPGPLKVAPEALADAVTYLDGWLELVRKSDNVVSDDDDHHFTESISLVLHELKRLQASV